MNRSIFWRLVWKEYRLQRALWISMAVLTVLVQLAILAFVREGVDRVTWLFAIGLGLPAFYALGCGATLFATEHEAETYEFQRSLPVSAMRLFGGKVALAVVSILGMIGLLWPLSAVLAGWQLPRVGDHLVVWGLWGLASVELLVWGMFFSLVCTRPLVAAVLAVTAASVSIHVLAGGPAPDMGGEPYLAAVPLRVAFAGLVALADIWLGHRWFRERIVSSRGVARLGRRETATAKTGEARPGLSPRRADLIARLLWQQWRQSASTMAALGALLVPLVLAGAWVWTTPAVTEEERFPLTMVLACVIASLIGSSVFLGDQHGRRFRFFAEQGVRPRYVWLSRQMVWITPLLLLTAAVVPLSLLFLLKMPELATAWYMPNSASLPGPWPRELLGVNILTAAASQVAVVVGGISLAYGSGQLCSMFLRSGILAAVFGLILTAALCGWTWLMVALKVSLAWSVAPIPLVLLLATWLRAPDWILERNSFRAWLRAGLSLLVPAALLLMAVPAYRVYDIPEVSPGFSPELYARAITPEQRATLEMYQRAWDLYAPWRYEEPAETEEERAEKESAWLKANQEAIAIMLRTSQRKDCDLFDGAADAHARSVWRAHDLGHLLNRSARQLQSKGKLDAAMERYLAALRVSVHLRRRTLWPDSADSLESSVYEYLPRWAAEPGQTPERIHAVIRELEKLYGSLPPRSDAIKSQYLLMRRVILADPDALAFIGMEQRDIFRTALWVRLLPWEKTRARRVLNVRTARDLSVWHPPSDPVAYGALVRYLHRPSFSQEPSYPFFLTGRISRHQEARSGDILARGLAEMETRRRAVRLLLALQAWRIEHGKLPETLDELVGPYLNRLPLDPYSAESSRPLDPYSAESFRYFPEGLPVRLEHHYWNPHRPLDMEAGTPFVWSTGSNVYVQNREVGEEEEYQRYHITELYSEIWRRPTCEYDVWASGWWFPLP